MKRLLLLCALALAGCATYTGELTGDHVVFDVTTSPFSVSASGQNMVGSIKKNGAEIAHLPPFSGTVSWSKATGFVKTPSQP